MAKLKLLFLVVCLLGFCSQVANAGSILFYMAFVSKSVSITYLPLAEELGSRGHDVTIISWVKSPKPMKNVREIVIKSDMGKLNEEFSSVMLSGQGSSAQWQQMPILNAAGVETNKNVLETPEVKQLLAENSKFDVVINSVFVANEMGYYLAHKFNATLVLYFTLQCSNINIDQALGQPHSPAIMSPMCYGYQHPMSFPRRVANTLIAFAFTKVRDLYVYPKLEEILDQKFPNEKRPSLPELELNAGLALQFGHPLIMDGLRPMVPNYIQVGMMNCRAAKPLQQHLQDFLDGADENGAIFVSFGSVLTASKMAEDKRKLLIDVFGRMKQRILWKWETEDMADKPDNVMLSKWLPQQDVLGHPKVRLFVSHGGQSSCQESLCHQKPMVVVSVFGDQPTNGDEAVHKGYGVHVPFETLTADNLAEAINKVLKDPTYATIAQTRGQLLLDQIDKPLDRAVWWIEYAIRHPGLRHFKSPVHDLAWYEYFLIDVFAFLFAVVAGVVSVFYFVVKCIFCRRSRKQKKE